MSTPIAAEVRTARVALSRTALTEPCRLELAGGLLAPKVVRRSSTAAHVALVATTACLLGGDELRLEVEIGPGLHLELSDVAGTVAYHGRGLAALVIVEIRVHAGATLAWRGEPLVVSEGADVERRLTADVADTGRLLIRDQVALGRAGEQPGSLRCRTSLAYAGGPALVEHLDLRAPATGGGTALRARPGMIGEARVIDSVVAVGWRPDGPGRQTDGVSVFSLDVPGSLARQLVGAAHESHLPAVWDSWWAQLREPQGA